MQTLTTGRISTQLAAFAWPLVLGNLFQALHNVTDVFLAGRFIGKTAMSAVTIGGQSVLFLTSFSLGLAAGGQILIAQFKGAKRQEEQVQTIGALFALSLLAGIVVALLGFFGADFALRFLQTPQEVFADARQYMQMISLGLIFTFLYNAALGVMRGSGDSRRPLLFAAAAMGIHAGLGFLFVGVWSFGIKGTAYAALTAQVTAALLGTWSLFGKRKNRNFHLRSRDFRPVPDRLVQILRIGLPFGLQMGILLGSNLFITRLITPYGVAAAAALGAGSRVTNLLTVPMLAIGNGASAIVGQSLGADKPKRAASAVRWALAYTLGFISLTTAVTLLFPAPLLRLFTDDPEVIGIGVTYLTIFAAGYLGHALHSGFNAAILGAGMTRNSLLAAGAEALVGRAALTWVFSMFWALPGIFTAQAVAPYLAAALSFAFWLSGRWKNHRLTG